jgi:hypothetical protein
VLLIRVIVQEMLSVHVLNQKHNPLAGARLGQLPQQNIVYGIPLLLFAELLEALATGLYARTIRAVQTDIVVRIIEALV